MCRHMYDWNIVNCDVKQPITHSLTHSLPFRNYGNLTRQQRLFNKTHSKCRQVIERAFDMLKSRFRRLLRFDVSDMTILVDSIQAACVLHNICSSVNDLCEIVINTENQDEDEYARCGHEMQGIQLRQQLMQQLVQIWKCLHWSLSKRRSHKCINSGESTECTALLTLY